jgi:hypothetical protein
MSTEARLERAIDLTELEVRTARFGVLGLALGRINVAVPEPVEYSVLSSAPEPAPVTTVEEPADVSPLIPIDLAGAARHGVDEAFAEAA